MAADVLGCEPVPFGATLFDKSPETNWLVAWHQDRALPLVERRRRSSMGYACAWLETHSFSSSGWPSHSSMRISLSPDPENFSVLPASALGT